MVWKFEKIVGTIAVGLFPQVTKSKSADWEVTKKPHLDAPNSAFSLKREIFPMQVGIVRR